MIFRVVGIEKFGGSDGTARTGEQVGLLLEEVIPTQGNPDEHVARSSNKSHVRIPQRHRNVRKRVYYRPKRD